MPPRRRTALPGEVRLQLSKWAKNDPEYVFWNTSEEARLLAEFGRTNFWTFFLDVFGAGANPKGEGWIDPEIHEPLANWFQGHVDEWFEARRHGRGEQKHIAILVPREMGKTTMISQAGQLWLHVRDPEISTYTGCESTQLSAKILDSIKAVVDGSDPYALFTQLYGNWSANARSWTAKQATHSARKNSSRRDPSFGTFSVETSITGSHPDVIFYDDPISYERLATDANWLATVNSQVTSLFPVIQSDGLVIWVGTRYDAQDHFGVAFEGKDAEGVKSVAGMETDSMEVREDGKWDVYFFAGRDKDDLPTTKIWPENRLKAFERRDPYRYASQVMNDPSLSETNPITKAQLEECWVKSNDVPWAMMRFAITTDTAFWDGKSLARRGFKDETVLEVWGYPRNFLGDVYFIEGYSSQMWRAEEFADRLVAIVQRYRAQGRKIFAITDEETMAGKKGAWEMSLRNRFHEVNQPMPNLVTFLRHSEKKKNRIVAAASFVVDGHVKIVENAPGSKQLVSQLSKIGQMMVKPNTPDDWADAMSDAFQPELYQPMRKLQFQGRQKPPWERGSQLFQMDDLEPDDFLDNSWENEVARPPIK